MYVATGFHYEVNDYKILKQIEISNNQLLSVPFLMENIGWQSNMWQSLKTSLPPLFGIYLAFSNRLNQKAKP